MLRKIQYGAGSDNSGSVTREDKADSANHAKNDRIVIREANKRLNLLLTLKERGINPYRQGNDPWSARITCPFPFHKSGSEKTGSFGYNYVTDRFHCFGCNSSGGAVDFIALKDGDDKLSIAQKVIKEHCGYLPHSVFLEEDLDPIINELLFDFSTYIYSIISNNTNNENVLAQIDKVTWWFDNYLALAVPKKKIVVEELEGRISKAKRVLSRYE